MKREQLKRRKKLFNQTFGKRKLSTINEVECRDHGSVVQVSNKLQIKQAMTKENTNKFILTCSSPLLQSDLVHQLGNSGEGELSQDIFQNRASLVSLDRRFQDLMKLFANPRCDHILPCSSFEQWNDHWSHCKEKTSSFLSGFRFRNYKTQNSRTITSSIKYSIANLAVKNCTPQERWREGVSILL